jgi:hypothetical protein
MRKMKTLFSGRAKAAPGGIKKVVIPRKILRGAFKLVITMRPARGR